MLFRTSFILLALYIVLVIGESSKNKVDASLTTITSKSNTTGKKVHMNKNKNKSTKLKASLCKLPRSIGPCRAAKQRFYYDSTANTCKSFTYGGCQGNKNNFRSLDKCKKTCQM